MEQMNRIELKGIVGSVRPGGTADRRAANFSLATSRAYTKKDGAAVIDTDWHNVVAWEGGRIPSLDKIEKGAKLHIIGRMKYNKWTSSDGVERTDAEVQASQIETIDEDLSSQMS